MMRSLRKFSILKLLLSIELFFCILSPKGIKGLIGYEGTYPNPQFFFMLFILPVLLYLKVFDFSRIKKYRVFFILVLLICFLYFFSTLTAINITSVNAVLPLKESVRQSLNYFIIFLPFLFLKEGYLIFSLKTLIAYGLFEICFVIYGILGFLNIVPITKYLKEVVKREIYAQSWTILGFVPKWGGTFAETQMLSTFLLICFIIVDLLEFKCGKNRFLKVVKLIFGAAVICLFSKSTISAFVFYLVFRKINFEKDLKYVMLIPLGILIVIFYPLLALKQEAIEIIYRGDLEQLGLSYSSLGERVFHLVNVLNFMSKNLLQFFFGLGPRTYGTLISLKYRGVFNENTNCISVFTVLSDIGFIGFAAFLIFLLVIYYKIKLTKVKIAYITLLISYLPQISWGHSIVIFFIASLINYDRWWERKDENIY
ncbi:hypothetical protein [Desulfonauticus submarinus]